MANFIPVDKKTLEFIRKLLGTDKYATNFPYYENILSGIHYADSQGKTAKITQNTQPQELEASKIVVINYSKTLHILSTSKQDSPYRETLQEGFEEAYDTALEILKTYIQENGIEGLSDLPSRVVTSQKSFITQEIQNLANDKKQQASQSYSQKKEQANLDRFRLNELQTRINELSGKSLTYEQEQLLAQYQREAQEIRDNRKAFNKELKELRNKESDAQYDAKEKQIKKSLKKTFKEHKKQAKKEEKISFKEKVKAWKNKKLQSAKDKFSEAKSSFSHETTKVTSQLANDFKIQTEICEKAKLKCKEQRANAEKLLQQAKEAKLNEQQAKTELAQAEKILAEANEAEQLALQAEEEARIAQEAVNETKEAKSDDSKEKTETSDTEKIKVKVKIPAKYKGKLEEATKTSPRPVVLPDKDGNEQSTSKEGSQQPNTPQQNNPQPEEATTPLTKKELQTIADEKKSKAAELRKKADELKSKMPTSERIAELNTAVDNATKEAKEAQSAAEQAVEDYKTSAETVRIEGERLTAIANGESLESILNKENTPEEVVLENPEKTPENVAENDLTDSQ